MEEMAALQQAEEDQDRALALFLTALTAVNRRYFEKVLDNLPWTEPSDTVTATEARQQNIRAFTRYRLQLRYTLTESGYDQAVSELMQAMQGVTIQIESYYDAVGEAMESQTMRQLARERLEQMRQQLIDIVPQAAYVEPVAEALHGAVMRGTGLADFRRQLRERLVESGLATKQVHQMASDALWMYHRNYSVSLGEQLGLTHYYYDGVKVAHSREWCIKRKGRAFTKKEIEEWASEDWQGKIPGTTKESIFWLCGGYKCIDVLRPITKRLYQQLTNNK